MGTTNKQGAGSALPGVVPSGSINNAEAATMPARSIKVNATNAAAAPTDEQLAANEILKGNAAGNALEKVVALPEANLPSLADGKIWVGDAEDRPAAVTPAGIVTVDSDGTTHVNVAQGKVIVGDENGEGQAVTPIAPLDAAFPDSAISSKIIKDLGALAVTDFYLTGDVSDGETVATVQIGRASCWGRV